MTSDILTSTVLKTHLNMMREQLQSKWSKNYKHQADTWITIKLKFSKNVYYKYNLIEAPPLVNIVHLSYYNTLFKKNNDMLFV